MKEHSCVLAVSGTAKLFKIGDCKNYKFLASNVITGRQNLLKLIGLRSELHEFWILVDSLIDLV